MLAHQPPTPRAASQTSPAPVAPTAYDGSPPAARVTVGTSPPDQLSVQLARCVDERAMIARGPVIQRVLSHPEYVQIGQAAQTILTDYPPDRFRYVGLGKSPTPIVAFLQSAAAHVPDIEAINMPLSKFGHRSSGMSSDQRRFVEGAELDAEQRDRLWEHFDRFILPGEDPAAPKDIVLMDHVESGKSLFASARYLEEYLKERYLGTGMTGAIFGVLAWAKCSTPSPPAVHMLPLTIAELQTGGAKTTMDALGLTALAQALPGPFATDTSLAARMGGEQYKAHAEYPDDFKISADTKPRTAGIRHDPNGLYAALRGQIDAFMAAEIAAHQPAAHVALDVDVPDEEAVPLL